MLTSEDGVTAPPRRLHEARLHRRALLEQRLPARGHGIVGEAQLDVVVGVAPRLPLLEVDRPPGDRAVEQPQVVGDLLGRHLLQRRDRDREVELAAGQRRGLLGREEPQPLGTEELRQVPARDRPRRLDVDDRVARAGIARQQRVRRAPVPAADLEDAPRLAPAERALDRARLERAVREVLRDEPPAKADRQRRSELGLREPQDGGRAVALGEGPDQARRDDRQPALGTRETGPLPQLVVDPDPLAQHVRPDARRAVAHEEAQLLGAQHRAGAPAPREVAQSLPALARLDAVLGELALVLGAKLRPEARRTGRVGNRC